VAVLALLASVPFVARELAQILVANDVIYEWETFSCAVFPTGLALWVVAMSAFRFECPHCRRTWTGLFAPACDHCGIAVDTRVSSGPAGPAAARARLDSTW
jgi:hypothetical protein